MMSWQRKALQRLIKETCNADKRTTHPATIINSRINNVHWMAASYDAHNLGGQHLSKAWPGMKVRGK